MDSSYRQWNPPLYFTDISLRHKKTRSWVRSKNWTFGRWVHTCGFPSQRASNVENASISRRYNVTQWLHLAPRFRFEICSAKRFTSSLVAAIMACVQWAQYNDWKWRMLSLIFISLTFGNANRQCCQVGWMLTHHRDGLPSSCFQLDPGGSVKYWHITLVSSQLARHVWIWVQCQTWYLDYHIDMYIYYLALTVLCLLMGFSTRLTYALI